MSTSLISLSALVNLAATLLSTLLLLPTNLLILIAAGLYWQRRHPRAIWLCWVSLSLLLVFSTRLGALLLVAPLEHQNPALQAIPGTAQAIVVLAGSRLSRAPDAAGKDLPSTITLARLRYAAQLHRSSGLPILVSGGNPDGDAESEAALMARSLHDDFGVTATWQDSRSNNTAENASNSTDILRKAGLNHVLLVTDAIHMPRALASFRHADSSIDITAAPTMFLGTERCTLNDFLPSGEGLRRSSYALHEWIGMLWYRLKK